ncbi:MAG: hypothetical protein AB8G05_28555 [Oligoflexales bacterium]
MINSSNSNELRDQIEKIIRNSSSSGGDLHAVFTRPFTEEKAAFYGLTIVQILFVCMSEPGTLYKFFSLQKYGVYLISADTFFNKQVLDSLWILIGESKLSDKELSEFFEVVFDSQLPEFNSKFKFRNELLKRFNYEAIFSLIRNDKIGACLSLMNCLFKRGSKLATSILTSIKKDYPSLKRKEKVFDYRYLVESIVQQMSQTKKEILQIKLHDVPGFERYLRDFLGYDPFEMITRQKIKSIYNGPFLGIKHQLLYYQGLGVIRNRIIQILGTELRKQIVQEDARILYRSILNWNFGSREQNSEFKSHGMFRQLLFLEDEEKSLIETSLRLSQWDFFIMILATIDHIEITENKSFTTLLHRVVLWAKEYEDQKMVSPFLSYLFAVNSSRSKYYIKFLYNKDLNGYTPLELAKELGYKECENYITAILNTMSAEQGFLIPSKLTLDSWMVDFIASYCKYEWSNKNIKWHKFELVLNGRFREFQTCVQHYSRSYSQPLTLPTQMAYYKLYFVELVSVLKKTQPHLLKDIDYLYQLICSDYLLEFSRFQENQIKKILNEAAS